MRLTKSLQARLSYLLTHAPVVWAMWFVAVVMSPHHYHAVILRTLALLCLLVIATYHLSHELLSYDNNNSLQDIFPHTCWCLRIRRLVNNVRFTEHPVQLIPTTPLTVWALVAVFFDLVCKGTKFLAIAQGIKKLLRDIEQFCLSRKTNSWHNIKNNK